MRRFNFPKYFESSWVCLLLALLVILPGLNCRNPFQRGRDAKIILHIGPHKTGSSHFQGQTLLMAKMLNAAGFCKNGSYNAKLDHNLAVAIQTSSHHDLDNFYRHCLDSGKRVIISSETFSHFDQESQFTALKRFIGNDSVHIVAVYREPLTRLQSIHSEIYKQAKEAVRSFHSFVKEYTAVKNSFFYGFVDRDVTRVVLCDVADVLCAEPYPSAS
eukprot:gene41970-51230_t